MLSSWRIRAWYSQKAKIRDPKSLKDQNSAHGLPDARGETIVSDSVHFKTMKDEKMDQQITWIEYYRGSWQDLPRFICSETHAMGTHGADGTISQHFAHHCGISVPKISWRRHEWSRETTVSHQVGNSRVKRSEGVRSESHSPPAPHNIILLEFREPKTQQDGVDELQFCSIQVLWCRNRIHSTSWILPKLQDEYYFQGNLSSSTSISSLGIVRRCYCQISQLWSTLGKLLTRIKAQSFSMNLSR